MFFDGKESYVRVMNLPFEGNSDLTIECRVTPLSQAFSSVFGNNEQGGVGLGISTSGSWMFAVGQQQKGINPYAIAQANEQVELGKEVHLAAVFDRRTVKLFVDGKLQASAEWKGPFNPSVLPFWIGADPCPEAAKTSPLYRAFHGLIDELRVSSAARYLQDFGPVARFEPDQSTLLLYHFDEGPGPKIYDLSGHHRFGEPIGAEWRERELSPAKQPSTQPAGATELALVQPIEEWLKGREVLTVAQDGSGMYRTIGEAVAALKEGQAVKVLDRGPYREALPYRSLPRDTGLVSLVGTKVEIGSYIALTNFREADGKVPYVGWATSFDRLSGFHIQAHADLPADAAHFDVLKATVSTSTMTMDHCRVQFETLEGQRPQTGKVPSHQICTLYLLQAGEQERSVRISECDFVGAHIRLEHIQQPTLPLAEVHFDHNRIRRSVYGLSLGLGPTRFDVRHNVIESEQDAISIRLHHSVVGRDLTHLQIGITNNLLMASMPIKLIGTYSPDQTGQPIPSQVQIHNNLFRSADGYGIALESVDDIDLAAIKSNWKVSHNAFASSLSKNNNLPKQPSDIAFAKPPLPYNADPSDENYLRVPADSPLTKSGIGGELPHYVGPFAPEPRAAKEDWFSRMRSGWNIASPETPKDQPTIERRAAEWVLSKGRTVRVTVNGEIVQVGVIDKLPTVPFEVHGIELGPLPDVVDADLRRLAGLRALVQLGLSSTAVTDAGLVHLESLTVLNHLTLNQTRVSDAGMKSLAKLPSLSWLHLEGTKVTDEGIRLLGNSPILAMLHIGQTKVSDVGLARIAKQFSNLHKLYLDGLPISDRDLELLAPLIKLRTLGLGKTKITDSGLQHLLPLASLEHLYVSQTAITDASIPTLAEMKSLKRLGIRDTSISPEASQRLQTLRPELQIVRDTYRNAAEFCFGDGRRPVLTIKTASGEIITATDASQLPQGEFTVQKVNLTGSQTVGGGLYLIRRLSDLPELILRDSNVTGADLRSLPSFTSLLILDLAGTQVTDQHLEPLLQLKTLKRLDLSNTSVTNAAHVRLKAALPNCVIVGLSAQERAAAEWTLRIGGSMRLAFEDGGARTVSALKDLPEGELVVEEIEVFGNPRVTDADARKFLTGLSGLKSLQIHHTAITDSTLEALRDSPTLENLHLEGTAVTDKGLASLGTLPALRNLMLNRTQITEKGLPAIVAQPALVGVNVASLKASDQAASVLLAEPRWHGLGLHSSWIQPDFLARISKQPNLRTLALYGEMNVPQLRLLAGLPELNHLEVHGSVPWNREMSLALGALPKLEVFNLSGNGPATGLKELATARPWRQLIFQYRPVPDELFDGLDDVKSLTTLRLIQTTQSRSRLQKFRADHPQVEVFTDLSRPRDRELTERLLRLGGIELEVYDQRGTHWLRRAEDIPDTEFQMWNVYVNDCPAFDDRMLATCASHEIIRGFNLRKSGVTDAGLSALDQLPQIAFLTLAKEHLTPRGLQAVSRRTTLQHLTLPTCSVEQLRMLAPLKLKLFACESPEAESATALLEQVAQQFPDLQILGMGRHVFDGLSAAPLTKLKKLERLSTQCASLTTDVVSVLAEHPTLRSMELFGFNQTPWPSLSTLQRIDSVHIGAAILNEVHLQRLAELPLLRKLSFASTKFSPESLPQFDKLRHVAEVAFMNCSITDDNWAHITTALPNTRLLWNGQPRKR